MGLGSVVEVVRERRDRPPRGVWEIVVRVQGPVPVTALPVKAEPIREFHKGPDVHEAAIDKEKPTLGLCGLGAGHDGRELQCWFTWVRAHTQRREMKAALSLAPLRSRGRPSLLQRHAASSRPSPRALPRGADLRPSSDSPPDCAVSGILSPILGTAQ